MCTWRVRWLGPTSRVHLPFCFASLPELLRVSNVLEARIARNGEATPGVADIRYDDYWQPVSTRNDVVLKTADTENVDV